MDVLHVITNCLFIQFRGSAANDNIARRAIGDFVCYVTGKRELSLSPANLDLQLC